MWRNTTLHRLFATMSMEPEIAPHADLLNAAICITSRRLLGPPSIVCGQRWEEAAAAVKVACPAHPRATLWADIIVASATKTDLAAIGITSQGRGWVGISTV